MIRPTLGSFCGKSSSRSDGAIKKGLVSREQNRSFVSHLHWWALCGSFQIMWTSFISPLSLLKHCFCSPSWANLPALIKEKHGCCGKPIMTVSDVVFIARVKCNILEKTEYKINSREVKCPQSDLWFRTDERRQHSTLFHLVHFLTWTSPKERSTELPKQQTLEKLYSAFIKLWQRCKNDQQRDFLLIYNIQNVFLPLYHLSLKHLFFCVFCAFTVTCAQKHDI